MRAAAEIIRESEVLIFNIGAGMGVASGIGTFRGRNEVSEGWGPITSGDESCYSMCKPRRFDENPHLAWGYSYSRECNFRETTPHEGYNILLQWATTRPYAIFTSNIDGHFERAIMAQGPVPAALVEYHGSINWMQCHMNCKNRLYPRNATIYDVHPVTGEANAYPTCPDCNRCMRHNICLIADGHFNNDFRERELARLKRFEDTHAHKRIAVVEIGAGFMIPTVREKSAELVRTRGARLIRINLDDPELDMDQDGQTHVSIGAGALESLIGINNFLL
jgi:NAD-dependent SIR2 family protein deacetylase